MTEALATWRGSVSGRWRAHLIPGLVWLGAAIVVIWLFGQRGARTELRGIARAEQREIAAHCDGRVALVPVRLFEEVRKGQTLVVLDDDRIRATLATASAEAARLQAELHAVEMNLALRLASQDLDFTTEARRFAVDVERTRIDMLEQTVVIETGRLRLQRLQIELDRLRELRPNGSATSFEYDLAVVDHATTEKEIEEGEKTLLQLRVDLQAALTRQDTFGQRHQLPSGLEEMLAPLRAAVSVQESRIAELSLERSALVLYSPLDGAVGEILRGEGEVIQVGEPILTVVASHPADVVAYVTAGEAEHIRTGTPSELEMLRFPRPSERIGSQVINIGPAVVQLPVRLWRNPAVPEWGCPIRLSIPTGIQLRCNEMVAVFFEATDDTSTDFMVKFDTTGEAL